MFDYKTVKLLHHHGNDDWVPMLEETEHGSAAHDMERAWLRGGRLYKCTTCEEEIVITEPPDARPDKPGA